MPDCPFAAPCLFSTCSLGLDICCCEVCVPPGGSLLALSSDPCPPGFPAPPGGSCACCDLPFVPAVSCIRLCCACPPGFNMLSPAFFATPAAFFAAPAPAFAAPIPDCIKCIAPMVFIIPSFTPTSIPMTRSTTSGPSIIATPPNAIIMIRMKLLVYWLATHISNSLQIAKPHIIIDMLQNRFKRY